MDHPVRCGVIEDERAVRQGSELLTVVRERGQADFFSDTCVAVDRNETQWRFVPAGPWKPGGYELVVDTAIEDLAGNRIGRAFDIDTFEPVSERVIRKTVSLPFRVGQD